ncbi:MAG: sigma-70 family RNA polymerase sigma factor [Planctomycetota bacterium]
MDTTWDSTDSPNDPLAALRDGDPGPFEAFVVAHARRLVGFFRRRGASFEEAEDLTQDVLLKLHNSAASYRPRERFGAYVARVAQNQLIDARRRTGARLRPLSLDADGENGDSALDLEAEYHDPLEPLSNTEQVARVREAVAGLSNAHQSVFELAIVEELSYAEIGELLGCPVGTVKSRVFHLVRLLRERLTPTDTPQR